MMQLALAKLPLERAFLHWGSVVREIRLALDSVGLGRIADCHVVTSVIRRTGGLLGVLCSRFTLV